MASLLDLSILGSVGSLFAFLLIWLIVYGTLTKSKLFDLKTNARALIAVVVAFLTLLTPSILKVVQMIVPWFALVIIGIFFIYLGMMSLGIKEEKMVEWVMGDDIGGTAKTWVIIISSVILVSGLGAVFFSGQQFGQGDQNSVNANTQGAYVNDSQVPVSTDATSQTSTESVGPGAALSTIFHPKILGLLLIMLVAIFTVNMMSK